MRCAAVQLNSGEDPLDNAKRAADLVAEAAEAGASFVLLPENALLMTESADLRKSAAWEYEAPHAAVDLLRETAKRTKVALAIGSVPARSSETEGHYYNRMLVIGAGGEVALHYDKIHLFDVDVPGDRSYRESERFSKGSSPRMFEYRGIRFGCSICYDVRFPELFRSYGSGGANVLLVPAAFTRYTGALHWEVLLRARAVETGCYVIAAAQCGEHAAGRETYGHSLVADPWGKIVGIRADGEGVVMADLDLSACRDIRSRIPAAAGGPSVFADIPLVYIAG